MCLYERRGDTHTYIDATGDAGSLSTTDGYTDMHITCIGYTHTQAHMHLSLCEINSKHHTLRR